MLLEKSGEITLERMMRWSQSGNNSQLWMCLVVKVKSDAVKNNIALKPGMLGQIGCDQTGDREQDHTQEKEMQKSKMAV